MQMVDTVVRVLLVENDADDIEIFSGIVRNVSVVVDLQTIDNAVKLTDFLMDGHSTPPPGYDFPQGKYPCEIRAGMSSGNQVGPKI
jgi:hypothetical protein